MTTLLVITGLWCVENSATARPKLSPAARAWIIASQLRMKRAFRSALLLGGTCSTFAGRDEVQKGCVFMKRKKVRGWPCANAQIALCT